MFTQNQVSLPKDKKHPSQPIALQKISSAIFKSSTNTNNCNKLIESFNNISAAETLGGAILSGIEAKPEDAFIRGPFIPEFDPNSLAVPSPVKQHPENAFKNGQRVYHPN